MPPVKKNSSAAVPETSRKSPPARLFWQTADGGRTCKYFAGHVVECLKLIPAKSIHCCVTSPPYWGLRDYGTGVWHGGREDCDHDQRQREKDQNSKQATNAGSSRDSVAGKVVCHKCSATREDYQLGSEPSPDCGTHGQAQCGRCFVCAMVQVFRGVKRVLRDDGTCWLNLGDTMSGGGGGNYGTGKNARHSDGTTYLTNVHNRNPPLPPGNLVGVPWRVALALQADGWILRQDIIWSKKSPMPESVRNRCTKAHEYVFLLTKRQDYFCDMEAIKEDAISGTDLGVLRSAVDDNTGMVSGAKTQTVRDRIANGIDSRDGNPSGKSNKRSVWVVSAQGFLGAHFATFPPALIEPMILAGTSAKGCCGKCGAPWERVVDREFVGSYHDHSGDGVQHGLRQRGEGGGGPDATWTPPKTTGWQPSCECYGTFEDVWVDAERPVSLEQSGEEAPAERDRSIPTNRNGITGSLDGVVRPMETVKVKVKRYASRLPLADHPIDPCVVLDPFVGSGTTALVALKKKRRAVGIDLNEKYLAQFAVKRVAELLRLTKGHLLPPPADLSVVIPALVPPPPKKVQFGKA